MRRLIVGVGVTTVLAAFAACEGRAESACTVDTECPQGFICRAERCGPVNADAGGPTTSDAGQGTCSTDGLLCSSASECCTGTCNTDGRCGAAATTQPPSCGQLYELCQNDCCAGLSCVKGTCR